MYILYICIVGFSSEECTDNDTKRMHFEIEEVGIGDILEKNDQVKYTTTQRE